MADLAKARLACVRLELACDLLDQVFDAAVNPPRGVGGLLDHIPMDEAHRAQGALRDATNAADAAKCYLSSVLEALELAAIQSAVMAVPQEVTDG